MSDHLPNWLTEILDRTGGRSWPWKPGGRPHEGFTANVWGWTVGIWRSKDGTVRWTRQNGGTFVPYVHPDRWEKLAEFFRTAHVGPDRHHRLLETIGDGEGQA